MTTPSPFPYRLYANDCGYGQSPALARKIWMRIRPAGMTWYAADCTIVSPTEITLYAYSMADSFRGGIGKKIFEQNITEFTDEERFELDKVVQQIYGEAAREEYERRQEQARLYEIAKIKVELFGE